MELLFFFSIAMIIYIYVGYPLIVYLVGPVRNKRVIKRSIKPSVTVLIAAYNEQDVIGNTIINKLRQDYPLDRLEIMVVSDGSSDDTENVVKGINDPRVMLLRQSPRAGKTSALNMAVKEATGDIIIFSDANSIYANDAVSTLVSNFADQEVGYVTGRMIYTNPDGTTIGDGCSTYMKYENALRLAETRLGSVVGVDGGIDAMRKELYIPMKPDQLPDFVLPLHVVDQGYRVVYDPKAVLQEPALKQSGDEYRMRVRVALRAFWALLDMRHLLSLRRNGLFAWQLWSHKVLRYICFMFLAAAWIANLMLLRQGIGYQVFFIFQNAGYVLALAAPTLNKIGLNSRLFSLARYFALLNLASAHAFCKLLMGKKQTLWTPRKG